MGGYLNNFVLVMKSVSPPRQNRKKSIPPPKFIPTQDVKNLVSPPNLSSNQNSFPPTKVRGGRTLWVVNAISNAWIVTIKWGCGRICCVSMSRYVEFRWRIGPFINDEVMVIYYTGMF